MKTIKTLALFLLIIAGFGSCQTNKAVQNQLRALHVDLDYELTSSVYDTKPDKTVYLNFIDSSNMEYFTSVRNNNVLVLPFIFFNYWHKKYNIVLGENTLTQPYWEFLTDALVAECNRSTCFNMKSFDNQKFIETDTDRYSLDVKIIRNETLSGIKESNSILVIPTSYVSIDFVHNDFQVLPASSDLEISVTLTKGLHNIFEKNYSASQDFKSISSSGSLFFAGEECAFKMAECLSDATKQIVEKISQDLNTILAAQ